MNERSRPKNGTASESLAVAAGNPNLNALLASCVEIDLRTAREDQHRYLRHALDGIAPGDVVKILVDRGSDVTAVYGANLRGVKVQLTASDVFTRRTWDAVLREVIA